MDVKSLTTIGGNKKELHNSSTMSRKEPWFEDKSPGDGTAENSFSSLYNSTLSWDEESECSKNKSWFDMVEEDEADLNDQCLDGKVTPEEKQPVAKESYTMPDIKIKEEVFDEDEYDVNNIHHHTFHSEAVIAHDDLPVVIKQEKVCDIASAGMVTKQDKCAIVVKQEITCEKSIPLCDSAAPQHGLEAKTNHIEKQSESVTLKQETDLVNIVTADSGDQTFRSIKRDVTDGDLKNVQTTSLNTVKQEKPRSYAGVVAHGGGSHAIAIKQETSPEKTTHNNTCTENSSEKNVTAYAKPERRLEEKTTKHCTKSGSAILKRERNSVDIQKADSNYHGRKKIKQDTTTCIEDSSNIQPIKFIKQSQDDDNKQYVKNKQYPADKCLNNETDSETYSSNENRKRSFDSSAESLHLKRGRSGSSSSSNSTGSLHQKREYEKDPQILARRQKQIDYGKNTVGYDNYRQQIPKEMRTSRHPRTPSKHIKYSRRGWDGTVKIWRQQLHIWDPDSQAEVGLLDSGSEISAGTGSVTSDDVSGFQDEQQKSGSLDDSNCYDDDYDCLNLDHDELHDLLD